MADEKEATQETNEDKVKLQINSDGDGLLPEPLVIKMEFSEVVAFSLAAKKRESSSTKIGIAIAKIKKQFTKVVDRHRSKALKPYRDALIMRASVHQEGDLKGTFVEVETGANPTSGEKYFKKIYTPEAEKELINQYEKINESLEDYVYDIRPYYIDAAYLPDDLSEQELAEFTPLLMTQATSDAYLANIKSKSK